jgi:hypothetical protein
MIGKLKPAADDRRLRREEKAGNPTEPAADDRRLRREEKAGNPTEPAADALRLRSDVKPGNLSYQPTRGPGFRVKSCKHG